MSNGKDLLPGVDGRSPLARRFRDLVDAILLDLQGRPISEILMHLIRSYAASAAMLEDRTARHMRGEEVDLPELSQVTGNMIRLARIIGIEPELKDITPQPLAERLTIVEEEEDA